MNSNSNLHIIRKRKSIRNYDPLRKIEKSKIKQLQKTIDTLSTERVRIAIVDADLSKIKLGTYGFISGAPMYLVGIVKDKGRDTTLAFGRAFEQIVLEATLLGLGTCWMAGTYSMKDFKEYIRLSEKESIVIVSPLGYASGHTRKRDKLIHMISGSHKRKAWEKIYYNEDWNTPLQENESGKFHDILDMVRIGPSSSNRQPWRIVKKYHTLHLYCHKRSSLSFRGYNNGINDSGIAMAHIDYTAKALGLEGNWTNIELTDLKRNDMEYIGSWTMG